MGGWGRDWAWRIIPAVEEVDLVGCCDSDPAALRLARKEARIPAQRCFASFAEGITSANPEAVLVTTLIGGHVPLVRAALEAGLHVLVEKPFAPKVAEARELVALAEDRGLTLMVSQNYRFFPAVREVARIVREGSLGRLHGISIDFRRVSPQSGNGQSPHHSDAQPLLVDMSIHHFDLLRLIVGAEPSRVSCEAWNPSWSWFSGPPMAVASIVFDGGPVVSYRGSWLSSGQLTPWAGEWRMDFELGEVHWTSRGDDSTLSDVVRVRPRGGEAVEVALPELPRVDRWGALSEFVSSVREKREPETSGRRNLGTLALASAAVQSASDGLGQPVLLKSLL
jgi:predicted dehydrogenase